jgi:hypothetical protein
LTRHDISLYEYETLLDAIKDYRTKSIVYGRITIVLPVSFTDRDEEIDNGIVFDYDRMRKYPSEVQKPALDDPKVLHLAKVRVRRSEYPAGYRSRLTHYSF